MARVVLSRAMATFGTIPAGTRFESVDEPGPGGRVRGEWVRAAGVDRSDAVLYYIHGSGYALCSAQTHRSLTSRLSAFTGLPVFAVDYRLAPRHRFPTAAEDARRGLDWLLERGHRAEQVALAGDSAGGHLAIDLCLNLRRAGRPLPAAQLLLSPLVDATMGLALAREQAQRDPMCSAAAARRLIALYTADTDPMHARLAHVIAADEALPPTLIQAGGTEMLAADAHQVHRMLTASGTVCELQVWPGQMHVFQAMPRLVPEADDALQRGARFLADALGAQATLPARHRRRIPRLQVVDRRTA
ncbi:alpha/beta hydrolase [Jatrophihabitans sp.]|uniref:alpha/beta hydrolase n=1 Tax=Jatrophihabitans sp. TaxID=1932789 RepID=UPI0039172E19